jgi:UDP-glucose 4-epimerase
VNFIASVVAHEVAQRTGQTVMITHLPMRPGEDERSVVLGDPLTLQAIGIQKEGLVPLEAGIGATIPYFQAMTNDPA